MKKVALLLVILFCLFTECKNVEPANTGTAVPSAQTGIAAPSSEAEMAVSNSITSSETNPSSQEIKWM